MLRAKNSAVPPEFLQKGGTLFAITGDPVLPYCISGNQLRGDNQHLDLYAHTKRILSERPAVSKLPFNTFY